jgi:teichuronic acid biosynthesis glycosyltransferase TuaH
MRIVLLSHTGPTGPFRVGSHHLARHLAQRGHHVAHISNPISVAHLARLGDAEVRQRAKAAIHVRGERSDGVTYLVPWAMGPLVPSAALRQMTLGSTSALLGALRHAGLLPIDLLLVDQPLFAHLLHRLPHHKLVYRPTDIQPDHRVRAVEAEVLSRANGVIATSAVVAEHVRELRRDIDVAVVENGVEFSFFSEAVQPWDQRLGACYVGALDSRLDWDVIRAMGDGLPDIPIDVYGPLRGGPPPVPGNVRLRGTVQYGELPRALASRRVGLLPLSDDPTNDGRSPMKLFEYLAAGMAVVARATPSIGAHHLADVHTYRTAEEAVAALASAHVSPPGPSAEEAARRMDWANRVESLLAAAESF